MASTFNENDLGTTPSRHTQAQGRGGTTGARILFLYPNERGMSTVPAAIAILSQLLKDAGHATSIFDTTFYKFDDEISVGDTDEQLTKTLNYI